jgi:hypothetical protein
MGTRGVWTHTERTETFLGAGLPSGHGTRTRTREFVVHPDTIKRLPTGYAAVTSPVVLLCSISRSWLPAWRRGSRRVARRPKRVVHLDWRQTRDMVVVPRRPFARSVARSAGRPASAAARPAGTPAFVPLRARDLRIVLWGTSCIGDTMGGLNGSREADYMSRSREAPGRIARMRGRTAIITAAVLASAAAFAVPAQANLAAGSPTLLVSGHPFSYTDPSGLSLELCINDPGCPASPPVLENKAPNDEAFYQLASTTASAGSKSVTMDFNLEAAYLGSAITFGRIQATLRGLQPNGVYTVTHPYGETQFTAGPNGDLVGGARAAQREEVGAVEGNFDATLATAIGPFLRWTGTGAPPGYIGDGVTPHTVDGSPTGNNWIRVSGPGLPPVVTDPVTGTVSGGLFSDLFTVEGKIAGSTPPPSAFASLSTTSLTFPGRRSDESSATRAVVLRNTGQVPLNPSVSTTSADFNASGCAAPVAPGGSCLLRVGFVANSGVGDHSATLNIASNAANNPNLSVALNASITGQATQVIDTTRTVVQLIPGVAPNQRVLPASAGSLSVSRLSLARRISVTRVRLQGLRTSMRLQATTKVVRIAVYNARNGRKTGRALFTTVRTPRAAGLYRVTLRNRTLLRKLKPGSYVLEVQGGRSAASLGAAKSVAFVVTR